MNKKLSLNNAFRCLLLLLVVTAPAVEIPDNYNDIKFGADTAKLIAKYPVSDEYKCKLARVHEEAGRGLVIYRLIYVKGIVDSVHLYFLDNRFAMAVEYYFPGREYYDQAVRATTGRFGQFVGSGSLFWRKQKGHVVRISLKPKTTIAMVSYLSESLVNEMQERLGAGVSPEEKAIDDELKKLDKELKDLDTPKPAK